MKEELRYTEVERRESLLVRGIYNVGGGGGHSSRTEITIVKTRSTSILTVLKRNYLLFGQTKMRK